MRGSVSVRNQVRRFAANKTVRGTVATARRVSLTRSQPGRRNFIGDLLWLSAGKYNLPPRCCSGSAQSPAKNRRTFFLSARTMTVNGHRIRGGRNCRETIARLRNARASLYHEANFLWLGGQRLLRRQHHAIAPITSKSRCAKCEGQAPDCTSDRPAAPATEYASFSHAVTLIPMGIVSKPIRRSTSYF